LIKLSNNLTETKSIKSSNEKFCIGLVRRLHIYRFKMLFKARLHFTFKLFTDKSRPYVLHVTYIWIQKL